MTAQNRSKLARPPEIKLAIKPDEFERRELATLGPLWRSSTIRANIGRRKS
jgi:hypothetical protein